MGVELFSIVSEAFSFPGEGESLSVVPFGSISIGGGGRLFSMEGGEDGFSMAIESVGGFWTVEPGLTIACVGGLGSVEPVLPLSEPVLVVVCLQGKIKIPAVSLTTLLSEKRKTYSSRIPQGGSKFPLSAGLLLKRLKIRNR